MNRPADTTIDDATHVRLGTGRWIVTLAVGVAVAVGVGHVRVEALERQMAETKAKQAATEAKAHAQDLQLQSVRDSLQYATEALRRLDAWREDEQRRGDVRPARGRQ